MLYPTIEDINSADRIQIARWYRSLPMPGVNHIHNDNFLEMCKYETFLMEQINERFMALGGMTTELSKIVGPVHRFNLFDNASKKH